MAIQHRVTPEERLRALKRAIAKSGFVRIIEAHSGLSGIVGETAEIMADGQLREYDGLWESSLTDSATKGLPDASIIGIESRLHTINEILHVTSKPMIVDGDTGGEIPQFEYLIAHLERLGVSAVIIEDKVFPKRNSLDASAAQDLEDSEVFSQKIRAGKKATLSDDFMIMARLESLIAGTGLEDALERAEAYIQAGADGIMIHSSQREPADLFAFVDAYGPLCARLGTRPALVGVPTTYNQHSDEEMAALGFNIVIHANHLLRASHKAMTEAARLILETGSSYKADEICSPVKEVFSAVGFERITASDRERSNMLRLPVIIPSAGKDPEFPEQPKSLIKVGGRHILDYQLEAIRKTGLKNVVIIRGHEGAQYDAYTKDENVLFHENPRYAETHALHSLMQSEPSMDDGFVLVYSDILFDHDILSQLVHSGKDIVLGIDNSYTYHKHNVDKRLDLVVSRKSFETQIRSLRREVVTELVRTGKHIETDRADFEFIGMAYFSAEGARTLRACYHDCLTTVQAPFHEADSFEQAAITDMFQELIDRGFPVHGLEVHKGWREIHTHSDVEVAEQEMGFK